MKKKTIKSCESRQSEEKVLIRGGKWIFKYAYNETQTSLNLGLCETLHYGIFSQYELSKLKHKIQKLSQRL